MRLTLKINARRAERKLEILVENLRDLDPVLSEFGKYLRAEAKKRFDQQGPGWRGLADTTKQRLSKKLLSRVTKGGGRVKRTERLRRIERALPEALRGQLFSKFKTSGGSRAQVAVRSAGRLEAMRAVGRLEEAVRSAALKRAHERELLNVVKELDRFAVGKRRRKTRSALSRHRLLGRLPTSITAKLSRSMLQVYSRVPWAGVHNVGGSAGKGSNIPARTFLTLKDEDMDVLEQMLMDRAMLAFQGG